MKAFLHIFNKKSADGSRKMWRCEHKDYSCRARIHTDAITGGVLKNLGDHNHDSNADLFREQLVAGHAPPRKL